MEEVFEKYKKEKSDDKGNIRESNLTTEQAKGLRELKEKTKADLVVMPTDKTMGLSIETKVSYKQAANEHIKDDEKVSDKVRKHTEAEFNSIGKAMIRFLDVGGARKHDDRIKEAMLTENVMLPPLSLYGKDHKPNVDVEKGPVRRPVVGASEGPNARVSDLAADVLNKAADAEKSKFECPSTEALQAKIEELNKRLDWGRVPGRSTHNLSSDAQLIQPSGSQVQSLQRVERVCPRKNTAPLPIQSQQVLHGLLTLIAAI